ncbi:synaptonemal complex central element protein 3 [Crotalus adamanteus]|uniref:Synaptonemal complex central element protein 3 n=1 Tax=Crotalus adamanteus TaxID=8729 RepID=A0AAW1C2B2_CROAD
MKVVGRRTGCKRPGIFLLLQPRKQAREDVSCTNRAASFLVGRSGGAEVQPQRPRGERRGMAGEKVAKCEPCERSYDNMVKMLEDLNRDLEKLLEDMEKLSVQATWMAYDMVVMRANPDLANSMRRLEDAFLTCKEEMEKNWQEMLKETKGAEPKQ